MKIAIIGYGKMGRMVETAALDRGHDIVSIIDVDNPRQIRGKAFRSADVAIEFSVPEAAYNNILEAWKSGMPVVSGTTGWLSPKVWKEIDEKISQGSTLLHSTNFSLGVNITMAASRLLARLLAPYPEYRVCMEEVHHVHKLDHPSGTAITLAEHIIDASPQYNRWLETMGRADTDEIPIVVRRQGEVPGIHEVFWQGPNDSIALRHKAKSRYGFAQGAVIAAEWLAKAPAGHRYSMDDVLGLK